jgi:hypothetical protein
VIEEPTQSELMNLVIEISDGAGVLVHTADEGRTMTLSGHDGPINLTDRQIEIVRLIIGHPRPEPEVVLPFELGEGDHLTHCYKCEGSRILGKACVNGCYHPASDRHLGTSTCCLVCRGES